jgi:hypothetical protein
MSDPTPDERAFKRAESEKETGARVGARLPLDSALVGNIVRRRTNPTLQVFCWDLCAAGRENCEPELGG